MVYYIGHFVCYMTFNVNHHEPHSSVNPSHMNHSLNGGLIRWGNITVMWVAIRNDTEIYDSDTIYTI